MSEPRLEPYLRAAGHDARRARALYGWNARLASAFLLDLAHLEVGLRNAFDRALCDAVLDGDDHWTDRRTLRQLFPVQARPDRHTGGIRDANAIARRRVAEATARARPADGSTVLPGKIIAELPFGFWALMPTDRLERGVWRPYLHRVYGPGTHRDDVRDALDTLRRFRNRVAHHECIMQGAETQRRRLVGQVRRLSEEAARDLARRSEVARLLHERP
ncbi:CAAX protease [Curtobacterium sp. MCBD17_019]|uniref:CAAX protease n=1 Tax=Curtobacterium sp. MCBD17_019 TaxID=2175669 RepID=UPI000DA978A9|nr:CAAX protease [Curtobacterium sp. MCBD17_019]PZE76221.1 CAAX protease [Curtobacterium sp. MCBD17_019]